MSVVREEFGPTLPELLGPRVRRLARPLQLALAAAGAVAVVVIVWLAFLRGTPGQHTIVVHGPVTFNLVSTAAVRRVPPRRGELLRLRARSGAPQSLAVKPLRLAPYRGDVTAAMTLLSSRLIDEMRRSYPGFAWRGDGRVNINKQPGYQISFQTRVRGRLMYGMRVLLVSVPDPPQRDGLDITLLSARSATVPSIAAVGTNGALKTPFRSLRFGASRP